MCTHEKRVVTVGARDAAHARHRRHRRRHGTRRQIDDALAIWPRTRDALRRTLADQQTVARTAHVLFAGRCVSDGLCAKGNCSLVGFTEKKTIRIIGLSCISYRRLFAVQTLDDVLLALGADIDHGVAHATRHHWRSALGRLLVRRRHLVGSDRRHRDTTTATRLVLYIQAIKQVIYYMIVISKRLMD